MPTSQRVLNGSITKGSTAKPVGAQDNIVLRDFEEQRQGINLQTLSSVVTTLYPKIRPASDEIRTFKGRDINPKVFDETMAPLHFVSSSINVDGSVKYYRATMGTISSGKFSTRLSHLHEDLNLGGSEIYDDGLPFFDTQNIDPINVIKMHPVNVELPPLLADHDSISALDGVIDPLRIRPYGDKSTIDAPFHAFGIRGSSGIDTDSYRRSVFFSSGINSGDNTVVEHFLDSVENMANVDLPGAVSDTFAKISPFVEVLNENEKIYNNSRVDNDIKKMFILSSSESPGASNRWSGAVTRLGQENIKTHDKMSLTGFQYDNNIIGVDSIAYGGLLK